jgi:hypothetical protein
VATASSPGEPVAEPPRIAGVYQPIFERIATVMRDHYPKVLAANRFFEEETEIHNEVGANNLNDALSHLGALFEQAESMTYVEQATEVHDFEGHLRRGMMESYEQIYRQRMGIVSRLWSEHEGIARPLQEKGKLHGVPPLEDLARLRRQCKTLLDEGRGAKRGHDWEQWDRGTESLVEACRKATELRDALDAGIAAAQAIQRERSGRRKAGLAALATAVVLVPATWLFNSAVNDDDSVRVPNVVGSNVESAATRLGDRQLTASVQPPDATSSRCRVRRQAPAPDREVDEGTAVTLIMRC